MVDLVIATRSHHKLEEIRALLASLPDIRVIDLGEAGVPPDPAEEHIEAFDTFDENALAKARYFAARTGKLVLADDSGLCVDALEGAPGVRSKRFSGRSDLDGSLLDQANNAFLLERLMDVPSGRRSAHYVCAVAIVDPVAGREALVHGRCDGAILDSARGSNGFGYDPYFFMKEEKGTFGELDAARKNEISHRGKAIRAAVDILESWLVPDDRPASETQSQRPSSR